MFEGFERKVVRVDGLDIACAIGGKGAPVLLLHGFPQTMAIWACVPQGWSRQVVHGGQFRAQQVGAIAAADWKFGSSTIPQLLP